MSLVLFCLYYVVLFFWSHFDTRFPLIFVVWLWNINLDYEKYNKLRFKSVFFFFFWLYCIRLYHCSCSKQKKCNEILFYTSHKSNHSWGCINFVTYIQNTENSGLKVMNYYKSCFKLYLALKPPEEIESLNRWLIFTFHYQ